MAKTKSQKLKANVYAAECPSREVLDHVTSTWGFLILVILQGNTLRFSEIRNHIGGISEKMLAQTLTSLERDGFINRKAYPVIPPKVEYSLTASGKEVAAKLEVLARWVEGNLPQVMLARKKYDLD